MTEIIKKALGETQQKTKKKLTYIRKCTIIGMFVGNIALTNEDTDEMNAAGVCRLYMA